jgi:hypothetical protein
VNKGLVMLALLAAACVIRIPAVQAANGHENNCSVVNVNYSPGTPGGTMTIICASGSINFAYVTGNNNSGAGTCPTMSLDDLKLMQSIALAARVSGLFLTVWYTDTCATGSTTWRAITSIELKGN